MANAAAAPRSTFLVARAFGLAGLEEAKSAGPPPLGLRGSADRGDFLKSSSSLKSETPGADCSLVRSSSSLSKRPPTKRLTWLNCHWTKLKREWQNWQILRKPNTCLLISCWKNVPTWRCGWLPATFPASPASSGPDHQSRLRIIILQWKYVYEELCFV